MKVENFRDFRSKLRFAKLRPDGAIKSTPILPPKKHNNPFLILIFSLQSLVLAI